MRSESPSEYISKHLDTIDPEQIKIANQNLARPFGKIHLLDSGKGHITQSPFTVDFSYNQTENEKIHSGTVPNEKLWELKNLIVKKDRVNQTLDISSLLPNGYKIYFTTGNNEKSWSSYIFEKAIVLNREPNSPGALLDLLHEIGHSNSRHDDGDKFKAEKGRLQSGDVSDLASRLLDERNAWAFALKKFKPFLDCSPQEEGFSINKQDVLTRIKNYALESYQASNDYIMRSRSSMYLSLADEEWMTGGADWVSNFDEDKLEDL